MRKFMVLAAGVLGVLGLIISVMPANATPTSVELAAQNRLSYSMHEGNWFAPMGESVDSVGVNAPAGCFSVRCDQHIGVFSNRIRVADASPTPTPEPATLVLLGTGLLVAGLAMRRRTQHSPSVKRMHL